MAFEHLKKYVQEQYPHLAWSRHRMNDEIYQAIDWLDDTNQTNESAMLVTVNNIQQKRILARLNALHILRYGVHYQEFIAKQTEPKLSEVNFIELSDFFQSFTQKEFALIFACASVSPAKTVTQRIAQQLNIAESDIPRDSTDYLAFVMTKAPEVYPAIDKLLQANPDLKTLVQQIFTGGHFRHMMYVEGGPRMYQTYLDNIHTQANHKQATKFWQAYWLADIMGFRGHIHPEGACYLNDNTYRAACEVMASVETITPTSSAKTLADYLTLRANWLNIEKTEQPGFFHSTPTEVHIMGRIAALMRLFSPLEGTLLRQGLDRLRITHDFNDMMTTLNPLTWNEPTPTFAPALLNNLHDAGLSYDRVVEVGLPIYYHAICAYRELRKQDADFRNKNIPLCFNGMASKENVQRILSGQALTVEIDSKTGDTKLTQLAPTPSLTT